MSAPVKTKSPATSKELRLVLDSVRKKREELDAQFDANPLDYAVTSKIAELREAENRLSERIAEAEQREKGENATRKQASLKNAYVSKCKEVGVLQEKVERLVDELIDDSTQLRSAYREVEGIAAQLDELPFNPPRPLWQRRGGQAVPYAMRVRNAVQAL